jgi:predicted ATPase
MTLLLMHNLDEVQIITEDAAQLSALGIQHEMILTQYSSGVFDGWLLAKQGDFASAIASFHYGLDGMQQVGHVMYHTHRLAMFIEALLWANQLEEAAAVLQEAFSVSERYDQHFWDAELYRLQGDLRLAQQQSAEAAEAAYHRAIAVAQYQGAKSLELRAVMARSRLWQRQGQTDQAYQTLSAIYGWFTEGFDSADLKTAKALLTQLSP